MTDAAVMERQLVQLAPQFAQVLGQFMPVERLIRTVVISCERNPKLLAANRQSLFAAAMSAACLGLEVDGVTGQAHFVPFAGRVQLIIGYKGYNTLAARSGFTIRGEVVRERDVFEPDVAGGSIKHQPAPDGGRIIGAWALAASNSQPSIAKVLWIDELLEIKRRSPGARQSDSPWNDPAIGFPAMCEKSVKRRLGRNLPLNAKQFINAAAMEEAFEERGLYSYITPDRGLVIEQSPIAPRDIEAPAAQQLVSPSAEGPAAATAPASASPSIDAGATPDRAAEIERALADASEKGSAALEEEWKTLHPRDQRHWEAALRRRFKPRAQQVDESRAPPPPPPPPPEGQLL